MAEQPSRYSPWVLANRARIESALSSIVRETIVREPQDPLAFIAAALQRVVDGGQQGGTDAAACLAALQLGVPASLGKGAAPLGVSLSEYADTVEPVDPTLLLTGLLQRQAGRLRPRP